MVVSASSSGKNSLCESAAHVNLILQVDCFRFHPPIRCLLKWLEIRSVCPMCNKPILRLHTDAPQGAEGPMDPEEV